MIEIACTTESETRATGRRLASLCRPGDVIVVDGPLGSGKTVFAAGLAEGLGVEETVNSPSFVIAKRYDSGFLPLVHVDVYRLGSAAEFEDLDLLDDDRQTVTVIEWGEVVAGQLPADRLLVSLAVGDGQVRNITLAPFGDWERRSLQEICS